MHFVKWHILPNGSTLPPMECRGWGERICMARVEIVEKKIFAIEKFKVQILHGDGADARSDKSGIPQYTFSNAAQNKLTVNKWIKKRFMTEYPGLKVKVLDADDKEVNGNTTLGNLRDTYLKE
jgi:hypothetical protein